MTRNFLATPSYDANFRVIGLKLLMVLAGTCLDELPKVQALIMVASAALIAYTLLRQVRACVFGVRRPTSWHVQSFAKKSSST